MDTPVTIPDLPPRPGNVAAPGDVIEVGGPGGSGNIPATPEGIGAISRAVMLAYVDPIAASRQSLLGFARSNGADTSRRIAWTMGAAGNVAGSPLSEAGHIFLVPSANPAATMWFFIYSSNGLSGNNWLLEAYITTAGALVVQAQGAIINTDVRTLTFSGFRAAYSGKLIRLDFVFTPGSTSPVVYVNGVAIAGTATSAGVVPDWMAASMVATVRTCGLNMPAGEFCPGAPINRALSAGEVERMVRSGALLPEDRAGGSAVNLTLVANSIRSGSEDTNTNAITVNTFNCVGTVEAGARTGGVGAYFSRGTANGGGAPSMGLDIGQFYPVGRYYDVRFWARASVSQTIGVRLKQANSGTSGQVPVAITTAWAEYRVLILNSGNTGVNNTTGQLDVGFGNGANGVTVDLDDVEIRSAGALIQPEITRTAQVHDHGPNRIRGVMTVGVRPLCTLPPAPVYATATTTPTYITGALTNPLFFESMFISEVWVKPSNESVTVTVRKNSTTGSVVAPSGPGFALSAGVWAPIPCTGPNAEISPGDSLAVEVSGGTAEVIIVPRRR